ncbi:hypothetical protein GALL_61760 [mine drainage metagenome]|uniref:Uncharacterized protein n=1 Tax=mine drainage metagenome TaxID=410659 RepID=A0A1J5T844_9ZZZZ
MSMLILNQLTLSCCKLPNIIIQMLHSYPTFLNIPLSEAVTNTTALATFLKLTTQVFVSMGVTRTTTTG